MGRSLSYKSHIALGNHYLHIFFLISYIFRFYPYIQLICCILLLATLVVYSVVPKLLNPYTSLMRHYVFNILIAFLVLAIFQLVEQKRSERLNNTNPNICTFIGKYSFWLLKYIDFKPSGQKKNSHFSVFFIVYVNLFLVTEFWN